MIARCILRGGRAAGEARRASCTAMNKAMDEAKRKKERKSGKRCHDVEGRNTRLTSYKDYVTQIAASSKGRLVLGGSVQGGKRSAYKNHNKAELPSGFLVSSTPSSMPTGKRVIEHAPMTPKITKSATS